MYKVLNFLIYGAFDLSGGCGTRTGQITRLSTGVCLGQVSLGEELCLGAMLLLSFNLGRSTTVGSSKGPKL